MSIGFLMLWAIVAGGCGGSGGGNDGDSTSKPPPPSGNADSPVVLAGTVFYERPPVTAANGLDYGGTLSLPVREAPYEIRSAAGDVLVSGNLGSAGGFSVDLNGEQTVTLVVMAGLGDPSAPDWRVVDNTNGKALYTMRAPITLGSTDRTVSVTAGTGWNGSDAYISDAARVAAPFAILDTFYDARQLIRSADPQVSFPPLTVNWSPANEPVWGDKSTGQIGTSHYSPAEQQIYILGQADVDTDEFDASVIAHEWMHYYEAGVSRSDSIGGEHGAGHILDPTVAFGEGLANAFSGMVLGEPHYRDALHVAQGTTYIDIDLEADGIDDDWTGEHGWLYDGFWSEWSVLEVLWDCYDGGPGAVSDSDGDPVALGFAPLHAVLTGSQKTTAPFTSIYTFLDALRAAHPGTADGIVALMAGENMLVDSAADFDAWQQTGASGKPYELYVTVATGTTRSTDMDGEPLANDTGFGDYNGLYARMFMRSQPVAQSGTYRLSVTPTDSGRSMFLMRPGDAYHQRELFTSNSPLVLDDITLAAGERFVWAVGDSEGSEFTAHFELVQADAKPTAPAANN
ncbi:MAG: hypothetical protein ACOCYP_03245 [Planctomycetota bacterium]